MMVTLILPLIQLADIVYLYDLVTLFSLAMLGFPPIRHSRYNAALPGFFVLLLALAIASISSMIRADVMLRPIQLWVQYSLSVTYSLSLFLNVASGRLKVEALTWWMVVAALIAGALGLMIFFLTLFAPTVAQAFYSGYLTLAGFNLAFYEERYLNAVEVKGLVRAMGTWDISTTYGGMLAAGASWLLLARNRSVMIKLIIFAVLFLTMLATGSRHSWVVALVILFNLFPGSFARKALASTACLAVVVTWILMTPQPDNKRYEGATTLSAQVQNRIDRTAEQGFEDSSLTARYVDGTARFFEYVVKDPTILAVGFGLNTDKALDESLPFWKFNRLRTENNSWGFVSNSWFLIIRNMGLLGLFGVLIIVLRTFRIGGRETVAPLLCFSLIMVADNYPVQVARCFFILMSFLAVVAADAAWRSGLAERMKPRRAPLPYRSM